MAGVLRSRTHATPDRFVETFAAVVPGVTVNGERDILGIRAGGGGGGGGGGHAVVARGFDRDHQRRRGEVHRRLRRAEQLVRGDHDGRGQSAVQTCVIHLIRNTLH